MTAVMTHAANECSGHGPLQIGALLMRMGAAACVNSGKHALAAGLQAL